MKTRIEIYRWDEVASESPIPLIHRQMVTGNDMMSALVRLETGCHVAKHHHAAEQIAVHLSGRALWKMGDEGSEDYREMEVTGGTVVVIPSNQPHEVIALEETLILDTLTPIGLMGIDRQNG